MIIINQQGYCNKKIQFLGQIFIVRSEYINGIAILMCFMKNRVYLLAEDRNGFCRYNRLFFRL